MNILPKFMFAIFVCAGHVITSVILFYWDLTLWKGITKLIVQWLHEAYIIISKNDYTYLRTWSGVCLQPQALSYILIFFHI